MEHRIDREESSAGSRPVLLRPSPPSRFCLFMLGAESFAVELNQVREIFTLESITPVPDMPPVLVGVANVHGMIVPLADLRPVLGMPSSSALRYAVIMRCGAQQIGIVIDEIPEIGTVELNDTLEKLPDEMAQHRPFLSGLLRLGSRVSGLVEVSRLMAMVDGTFDQQAA
jgi:purine-binding chemotaxis protein CheW